MENKCGTMIQPVPISVATLQDYTVSIVMCFITYLRGNGQSRLDECITLKVSNQSSSADCRRKMAFC